MNQGNIMDANSFLAAMYLLKEMAMRSDLFQKVDEEKSTKVPEIKK